MSRLDSTEPFMEKGAALASPRGQDAPSGSRDAAVWEGDGLHPALASMG